MDSVSRNSPVQHIAPGQAASELFAEHRDRLERMVHFRLDARLRRRIDPADVLQEAYLVAANRVNEQLTNPTVSDFVWIRQITFQALIDLQRKHFRAKRSVNVEIQLPYSPNNSTTDSIASALVGHLTSASRAAVRAEEIQQIGLALASMDATDREVLALRHFEQAGNREVAEILGLSSTAASNRYVRALARLGEIMKAWTNS